MGVTGEPGLTTNTAGPTEEFHQPGQRTGMALKAAGGVLLGVGQAITLTLPSQSTTWRELSLLEELLDHLLFQTTLLEEASN